MAANLRCPHHPNAVLIEEHRAGDIVCPLCGFVVGDRIIDVGTEWRTFSDERTGVDPSRVGAPVNTSTGDTDLSTTFAVSGSSDYERSLMNAQRRNMGSSERQLNQGIALIREMSERITAPRSLQDRAIKTLDDVLKSKCLHGKNIESKVAACLFIACRMERVPRTFKEICAISSVSKKEIGRCFKVIVKTLENSFSYITSAEYMGRFCGHLGLPFQVQTAATRIAKEAPNLDLVAGRSPISIAAAAIYMASQASSHAKSPKEIGTVVGVAPGTIQQTYKLMLPRAKDLFPEDFKFEIPIELLPSS